MTGALALAEHPVLRTTDPDRARAEIGAMFCPHGLVPARADARLDVVHNSARIAGVGVNYLHYGTEVRITPGTFDTFFLVQIPLAGRARVRVGARTVLSDGAVATLPSPTEPVDMVWSDHCAQLMVYLERDAVERAASAGDVPGTVVFDPRVDLRSPAVRSWVRWVRLACDDLDGGGGILDSPAAAVSFEQTLIAGLLAAQPHRVTAPDAGRVRLAGPRAVAVATEIMRADPARPWRVADLAARVGVSVRSLQEAFQAAHGVSPLTELRRIRLACVHDELRAGAAARTSVTAVASRWGFFHLGRFAHAYRVAYGEAPSATLRRAEPPASRG